jgi:hypothetical protein
MTILGQRDFTNSRSTRFAEPSAHYPLLDAARDHYQDLRPRGDDSYGRRYVLDFEMSTPVGTVIVRSTWIVRTGENVPRFITCDVPVAQISTRAGSMNAIIQPLDVVALTVDLPEKGLLRGQVGTVVELFGSGTYEVEFVDEGRTYAQAALRGSGLPHEFSGGKRQRIGIARLKLDVNLVPRLGNRPGPQLRPFTPFQQTGPKPSLPRPHILEAARSSLGR